MLRVRPRIRRMAPAYLGRAYHATAPASYPRRLLLPLSPSSVALAEIRPPAPPDKPSEAVNAGAAVAGPGGVSALSGGADPVRMPRMGGSDGLGSGGRVAGAEDAAARDDSVVSSGYSLVCVAGDESGGGGCSDAAGSGAGAGGDAAAKVDDGAGWAVGVHEQDSTASLLAAGGPLCDGKEMREFAVDAVLGPMASQAAAYGAIAFDIVSRFSQGESGVV